MDNVSNRRNQIKHSLIFTLFVLILLTGSLMPTRAAVEPLATPNTDEPTDGPVAWSSPPQPEVFDGLTAPLIALSGFSDSAMHAPSANVENVEFVGHIGGSTYSVFVQGNYAYIGQGPHLTILDISNQASPSVVGKTAPFPDIVQDIYVSGDYAYVTSLYSGLRVVDISVPSNPTEVGFYDTPGLARGVAVAGDYAYIADGYDSGLRVVDISSPSSPSEVGFYDTPGEAFCVAVAGDYAYVGDGGPGLRVVDISSPSSPSEVGFYDTPGYADGVAVMGDYAYVADGYSGLRVVDISNPSNPSEVGFYDTPEFAENVAVAGDYVYVADWYGGLRVVDISVPSNPTEVGFYDTLGDAEDVAVAGDRAYVIGGSGLQVFDISDPSNPSEVGIYDTPGQGFGVAVARGASPGHTYVYVADTDGGLIILSHAHMYIYLPVIMRDVTSP